MFIFEIQCIILQCALTQLAITHPWSLWVFCITCLLKSKNEPAWYNWFEILKLVSIVISCLAIDFEYKNLHLLLRINILEAVVSDLLRKKWFNACAGWVLIFYQVDMTHALVYSLWNAAFSYGKDFSRSTRLLLITPFIIANNHSVWLEARSKSLLINMALRSVHFTTFFTPEKTSVTHKDFNHDSLTCKLWGGLNLTLALSLLIHTQ